MLHSPNEDYRTAVQAIFDQASFVRDVGIRFVDCGPGWCETQLDLQPRHRQHDGFVHAGVQGTMADHTAGAAAFTLAPPGHIVLTVEYKIHLLRPAQGERLFCRADVLKPGRRFSVVEAEVFGRRDNFDKLVSKLVATMAILESNS